MTPEVSVLLPAFNAARTLAAALRSVQRQSERNWECIVVDDGSADDTLAIARAAANMDARIRVIARSHAGIVPALQAGMLACRAPLVARMDADDLMSRLRLQLQCRALAETPGLCAVGSLVRVFPRAALREGRLAYERWLCGMRAPADILRERFVECPIAHPTLLIKREVLSRFAYRDCGWPEDYDLILRLLEAGELIGVVPRRLLHWRDGEGRLSRTAAQYQIAAFVECKAEFLARGFLAHTERYLLWGYGDTGKALAQALAQRGKHPAAILELHPRRLGQWIRGVRVVLPDALPTLPRLPLIVSVAGATPRAEIRSALSKLRFVETSDYVCAA